MQSRGRIRALKEAISGGTNISPIFRESRITFRENKTICRKEDLSRRANRPLYIEETRGGKTVISEVSRVAILVTKIKPSGITRAYGSSLFPTNRGISRP